MRPDGVYLHLGFDEYLAEPDCLGSSEKITLHKYSEGLWWKRRLAGVRKPTEELLFGEALHAALLEGLHSYESRYIVEPSRADYPDAIATITEIRAAMKDAGVHPSGASGWKLEDWCEAAETYLPEVEVWPNIQAEFRRRSGGRPRKGIPSDMDFAIRAMRDLATDAAHSTPDMRELFSVGSKFPVLAEVSVFYTDADGLRHRARFDKLLPGLSVDLKSVGEWRGRGLVDALDTVIKDNAYDVQLADYHVARQEMIRMVLASEDAIHGGTEEERQHLIATCHWNLENQFEWAWIFGQKPSAAGAGPVIFPLRQRWRSGYHLSGFRKRAAALATYRRCMTEFGPDRPWGRVEPMHYTMLDDAPRGAPAITNSPWGWGPSDPAPGEEEHFLWKP